MIRYCQFIKAIMQQGADSGPLDNTRKRGLFGDHLDIRGDFPLLTTTQMDYATSVRELLTSISDYYIPNISVLNLCIRQNPRVNVVQWGDSAIQLQYLGYRFIQMVVYKTTADVVLDVPKDIAKYATLLRMYVHLAVNRTGWDPQSLRPGKLTFCYGDVHLRVGNFALAEEQSNRVPGPLPLLEIEQRGQMDINDFEPEDFHLSGYHAHPHIPYEVYE